MSKFGELINLNIPILLYFYAKYTAMNPVLMDVAVALRENGKVVKIDINKNKELSQILKVKGLPTFMIYKKGEMVWRQSGEQDANTLIGILNEYL